MNVKRLTTVLVVIVFILGLGILLYPTFSDLLNQFRQDSLIDEYIKTTEDVSSEDLSEQIKEAAASGRLACGAVGAGKMPQTVLQNTLGCAVIYGQTHAYFRNFHIAHNPVAVNVEKRPVNIVLFRVFARKRVVKRRVES